ncbi:putative transmembrane efflux protein [Actinacidiphila reveromycinica]|uniref:Putative transmembrane efflux protein n=1 Tax=Actinacidiphila reveromycinica TaxID=659352 RepID=A0A7U3UN82_9ACTN|nr:MDR family MFS transporter [Streptomyces sp. SN-593]BBA95651.1 putative transmembrane efflux protein [Streptomyces sp. SN-593]
MSATSPGRTGAPSEGALSHRQILTILSGLVLGMFLAALDQTIVSTAIKTIGNDLDDLSAQAWVTTAFLITSTIAAPLFGKLSDLYGRKRLFMFSIVIFVVGSALCGLAQSMYELAAFRAFQGIGAGGIMPLALAVIGDIIPPRERARYQGYMMAVFASASVLGPVLGGLFSGTDSFLGTAGWRWIFYINVPVAAIALVVIAKVLHLDHVRRERRIDWWGSVLLAVGLVPLLVVAEQGQSWGWASAGAFACYLTGAAGLALFVWVEHRMGDDALLPLRLFRSSTFSVASAQVAIIGMAMFGGMSVIPLYLQIVKGASPTKSGLLMLPMVAGLMLASLGSGRLIARTGRYKVFPVVGSVLMVLGMSVMTTIGADTPLWRTDIYMAVFGIGLGLNMQSLVLAMQNAVPAKDMGVASASSTFFRSIGGTLGTAIFLSVLFSQAGSKIGHAYTKAAGDPAFVAAGRAHPDQIAALHQHLGGGLDDTSFLNSLARPISHPFFAGFSSAGDVVFTIVAVLLLAAIVLSVRLKEVPLRLVSGNQARSQAEAPGAVPAEDAGAPAGTAAAPGPGLSPGTATVPGTALAAEAPPAGPAN